MQSVPESFGSVKEGCRSLKKIRDWVNQSIFISQWWACFVFFFSFFYGQDAERSNPVLCQQKYNSNKSVYCYGENHCDGKCTSLRLYLAIGKLQNVLPLQFPTSSSLHMTPSMATWEKAKEENKKEWTFWSP